MIHLGLIGFPLGHSLSPGLHAAALKACGLDGDYSLFPISPDDQQGLQSIIERIQRGEIHGLNVTIPHKQGMVSFLDELTPAARGIGAVNTIYLKDDRLVGHNTDAQGFITDLKRAFNYSRTSRRSLALVLGAGGSSRAVIYALLNDGWQVVISARRAEQAQELARQFPGIEVIGFDHRSFHLSNPQLIVNTTPLGMMPNPDQSPWPENLPIPNAWIYDLVYNPRETKFAKDACAQGLQSVTGLGMLVEQAALAFETWTGCGVSRETLWNAVEN